MPGPGRPPNEKDILLGINGSPRFLGVLASTGAAVDNQTTATPFNFRPLGPVGSVASPANFTNTLAGKTLLLQPTAAGLIRAARSTSASSSTALVASPTLTLIALQSVIPVAANTEPGVALVAGDRVYLTMMSDEAWLQWLPLSGSANCLVWESL
jgi:hypothetical protein